MNIDKCPHCGYDLQPNAKMCPCCGYKFQPPSDGNDHLNRNAQNQPNLNNQHQYYQNNQYQNAPGGYYQNYQNQCYGNTQNQYCNTMQNANEDTFLLNRFYKESSAGGVIKHGYIIFLLLPLVFQIISITFVVIFLINWMQGTPLERIANYDDTLMLIKIVIILVALISCLKIFKCKVTLFDFFTLKISNWLKTQNTDCRVEFNTYYTAFKDKYNISSPSERNKHRFMRAVYLRNIGSEKAICYNLFRIVFILGFWISFCFFSFGAFSFIMDEVINLTSFNVEAVLLKCCSVELTPLIFLALFFLGEIIYEAVASHVFNKHFKEWAGKYMAQ